MTIYTTKDGDTLDHIVWQHYGTTAGTFERVLALNRHLANYDAVLPAGVQITLPDLTNTTKKQKIKMWQ